MLRSFSHELDWAVIAPMFTGEVLMGTDLTKIDVVYDTGSDWLVIPDVTCLTCEGDYYDNTKSTPVGTEQEKRTYGSAALVGKTFSDKVCLNNEANSCVEGFEYFSFTNQRGLSQPLEGIMGMS